MPKYDRLAARLDRLEALVDDEAPNNIEYLDKYSFVVNGDEDRTYRPFPTLLALHQTGAPGQTNVVAIKGPFGSGKSVGCMSDIVFKASNMPFWHNGIRRSKWLFVRNTAGQLETTTLQTWLAWFGDLDATLLPKRRGDPVLTYIHRFKDYRGWVEMEILFLGLDKLKDTGKIKSLDITGAYINEVSEINKDIFELIIGRCGRYPTDTFCKELYWKGVIADTNPPMLESWVHRDFDIEQKPGYILLNQPPALLKNEKGEWENNPERENAKAMGNYWLDNSRVWSEEKIKVYCLGQYGVFNTGKVVYPEYNDDIHSVPDLELIKGAPLYLSFDFGLTPCCLIAQQSYTGQIRIVREVCGYDMGLQSFIDDLLLPVLGREFSGYEIEYVTGDPAGNKGVDTDQNTCFNILNEYWPTRCEPAVTNDIMPRLEASKYLFSKLVNGKPLVIVSRKGAPTFRTGLLGKYIFKLMNLTAEKRYKDVPDKNEWSHTQDAFQYIALYFTNLLKKPAQVADVSMLMSRGTRF